MARFKESLKRLKYNTSLDFLRGDKEIRSPDEKRRSNFKSDVLKRLEDACY